jgi:Tol biopolymer transport system component
MMAARRSRLLLGGIALSLLGLTGCSYRSEVRIVGSDGTAPVSLDPKGDFDDDLGGWSPDGSAIVVDRDGDIAVSSRNGNVRLLTKSGLDSSDGAPAWSPDGRRIVFTRAVSVEGNYQQDVYVMGADGSRPVALTPGPEDDGSPSWSPDSRRVAFVRDATPEDSVAEGALYVMGADGSGLRRLVSGVRTYEAPSWSPDGARLAFATIERRANSSVSGIAIARADGSGVTPVTGTSVAGVGGHHAPRWSPDGSRIAFSGHGAVQVVNTDGSGLVRLVDWAGEPSWSPDGTRIAFCCPGRKSHSGIFVMNSDGSGVTRLAKRGRRPVWSPDGSAIAFEVEG